MSLEHSPGRSGLSPASHRIVRLPVVMDMTGLSRTTIWRLERDGQFPKRRRLSANSVGWIMQSVQEWIAEREAAA